MQSFYTKHFTKGTHNTCNLLQWSLAHYYQYSVSQAQLTLSFMSQCVSDSACTVWLPVIGLTCLLSLVMI